MTNKHEEVIVNPEVTTPDPVDRADASFLIWQSLGGIRESIGRLEGKLDSTSKNVDSLKDQVGVLDGKISKAKSSVDRIYWTIAVLVVVFGALSPILLAGLKVIFKVH
jgi:hypothetical protein